MKGNIYFIIILTMVAFSSCRMNDRMILPSTLEELRTSSLFEGGCISLLQIIDLLPGDTISLYINEELVLKELTVNYPYPGYIDMEKWGGHGEYNFDFLLWKRNHKIKLVNMNDPHKKVIKQIQNKETLIFKAVDERGERNEVMILGNNRLPASIRFFHYSNRLYADTLNGIKLVD